MSLGYCVGSSTLLGRAEELAVLDGLLADLHGDRGRAVVVEGEAGIGKSALLDALVERCGDDVVVLRAGGVEREVDLAFSGLSDLLAPVVGGIDALPGPQAAALAGALALGPPQSGERLAICVAALGLVRSVGAPVLVVVDDLQWLDRPSQECVRYLARRAGGRVAVVLATRDTGEDGPALQLRPLAPDASRELLRRRSPALAAPVAQAIAQASQGNPLALEELPSLLSEDQRSGLAAFELPLPSEGPLHRAFGARVERLPQPVRDALLVAALNADEDLAVIAAGCAEAGTTVDALAAAEGRGLVRIGLGTVTFTHPLIRAAARGASTAAGRRAAHRALAAVVQGDARAWHRAAAATGPEEGLARELEQLGAAAAARRGFATAAAALERAASLSTDRDARARRLLAAGHSAAAAGAPQQALSLLQSAAQAAGESGLRARAAHGHGVVMLWTGAVEPAAALLAAEAERVLPDDPVQGAVLLADAATALTAACRYHDALACAQRAAAALGDRGPDQTRAHVLTILAYTLILRGQTRRAVPLLDQADRHAAALDALAPGAQWTHLLLRMRLATEQYEHARETNLALSARARDAGALAALGGSLVVAADAAYALGKWDAVDAETREALAVADDTSQQIMRGFTLTTRARLLAARGDAEGSRHAAESALELARGVGIAAGARYALAARGFLELGLDRIDAAIEQLEEVERLSAETGVDEPTLVPWAGDLIEAYVRAGAGDAAHRVIATLDRQATSSGSVVARATLARGRGLLDDDYAARFADALRQHDRRPMPFERARTLLAYGRRLHRARRRADARAMLREALAGFEHLRAETWAAQARRELKAAGARRRAPRSSELTAQERRVARAVARGATNHEVAAELFLSPRTVEFHLRHVYRKLDVHNRTELAARLSTSPDAR